MYYREMGDKKAETIVFIHGGGISGWMWRNQWEAFQDCHLLIPDLPEHGGSLHEGHIGIKDGAERVAALIQERANRGKAHVAGHSLGAKIAVELIAAHPELVDHAVVLSALFRPMPALNLFLNMPVYRLTLWMMKSRRIRDFQMKAMGFSDAFYKENYIKDLAAQTPEMLARVYAELNAHLKLPSGHANARVPTLVLAGEREPVAMRGSVADIAGALPDAQGFLVKGGRHTLPWEQPEVINRAIRSWISGRGAEDPALLPVKTDL